VSLPHWQDALDDYDETAALVCALDLVISVCTAVIHLTGALGKPVWILVPAVAEWRYLRSGETLPWYPSARLFRQAQAEDWQNVIGRVSEQLAQLSGAVDMHPM
jgi:ADP-heptose:LPS heptosyltransferase